jgi:hypothetical protein
MFIELKRTMTTMKSSLRAHAKQGLGVRHAAARTTYTADLPRQHRRNGALRSAPQLGHDVSRV